jgi:predicted AlkP superfamily pyrophosphatase or phosphodiesterase
VYDGDLDATGHRFGVDSDAWRAQLQAVDEDVQELRAALPDSVGLVVTADHGMVDATTQSRIDNR